MSVAPRSILSLATIGARRFKPSPYLAASLAPPPSPSPSPSSASAFASSSSPPPPARLLDSRPFGAAPHRHRPPPESPRDAPEANPPKKGPLARLHDRYSPSAQRHRMELGERLFRSAQRRASDPVWFARGRVPYEFRNRHALLTLHVWFLHRRAIADGSEDSDQWLMVQEEMFDRLWNDTTARIRAEGVSELTVTKHLKDVQSVTLKFCTHLDHALSEHATDSQRRFQELAGAVWAHVMGGDEDAPDDSVRRIAAYTEYQYRNIMLHLPDHHFAEGRIGWMGPPDFTGLIDNDGVPLPPLDGRGRSNTNDRGAVALPRRMPGRWIEALTDAGDVYYWNEDTMESSWEAPTGP